jgi:hypothetical protein
MIGSVADPVALIVHLPGDCMLSVTSLNMPVRLRLQEEEKLVRDVMRHMVFRNQVKPDVPVPRADLAKLFPAQVQTLQLQLYRADHAELTAF